jgi:hypothetical protein
MARPEIIGLPDASAGLGAADLQPIGQRLTQLAAQLGLAGLAGELVDQCVPGHRQPTGIPFQALQHSQEFPGGQNVERQLEQPGYRFMEGVEPHDDLLATTRMHVRIISTLGDTPGPPGASVWMKLQLWITRKNHSCELRQRCERPKYSAICNNSGSEKKA